MKALIYKGPGKKAWDEVPDPKIEQPTDVIVKMVATTICGTDLHILKGDVPEVEVGRILGHEGIGVITEVGEGVTQLAVGDRVILACVSSCGKCSNCRKGLYSHCLDPEGMAGIGWIFGYMIDGTQAEYVRVPFAENSVYKVPEGMTDAEGILLSDILPTGFEIGVQYGHVAPGDVVAVIGSGPVGLSAVMTARLYGPSKVIAIDLDNSRLARAADFGATDTVNSGDADWKEQVLALTDGLGVDVAIEAVGVPETFTMATVIVRPGRQRRQHRRARQVGRPRPQRTVDPEHRYLHGPGQHEHARDAAQARGRAQAPRREVRDPRVLIRPDARGVRSLRARGGSRCAEGPHPLDNRPN